MLAAEPRRAAPRPVPGSVLRLATDSQVQTTCYFRPRHRSYTATCQAPRHCAHPSCAAAVPAHMPYGLAVALPRAPPGAREHAVPAAGARVGPAARLCALWSVVYAQAATRACRRAAIEGHMAARVLRFAERTMRVPRLHRRATRRCTRPALWSARQAVNVQGSVSAAIPGGMPVGCDARSVGAY